MLRPRIALILVLLTLLVVAGCKKSDAPPESLGPGAVAPDFTLKDTAGKEVSLAQMRGKVVFLNFWATWCPPCRSEMPSMERLNEVYGDKDFVMLTVNVDEDGMDAVGPFLKEHPHRFAVLLDRETKVQELYGVYRFPETFVIDKEGKVVDRIIGGRDWSSVEMLKYFSSLIARK